MADIEITVDGGTSKRLLTAGKYCDKNILVTATGGGEGIAFFARSSSNNWSSTQEISCSLSCIVGELVLAIVLHRDNITTPEGWTLMFCGADIKYQSEENIQKISIFYKFAETDTETFTTSMNSASRASIVMCLILNGSEDMTVSEVNYGYIGSINQIIMQKEHPVLSLHVIQRYLAGTNTTPGTKSTPDWISHVDSDRLSVYIDWGVVMQYEVSTRENIEQIESAYFFITIPKSTSKPVFYDKDSDTGMYDLPSQTALNIITGVAQ